MHQNSSSGNLRLVSNLMFRLLPAQILMLAIDAINSFVSSFFASNYLGLEAMSAIGLYAPFATLGSAVCAVLTGGASILCGKYMGQNDYEKVQKVFHLDLVLAAILGAVFMLVKLAIGIFDLSGFLTTDAAVRPALNRCFIGMAIGNVPYMISTQLPVFLALENQQRRMLQASLLFTTVNLVLSALFVPVLHMGVFGLAFACSVAEFLLFYVMFRYYLRPHSIFRLSLRQVSLSGSGELVKIGLPGALSSVYLTARGFLINALLLAFVGSVGVSAYGAAESLLSIFWAVPSGMLIVSRMLISVSVGEEDRRTLADIMRVMFRRYLPLMGLISALLMAFAVPLTRIYFRDPTQPVYAMTVSGMRILPLSMPLALICIHFICYAQTSNKQVLVHLLSLLDGVVNVVLCTFFTIRYLGIQSPYVACVFNGVVTTVVVILYAWVMLRYFPRNMEELMVIPASFGAKDEERMDLSVHSMEDVVSVSQQVIAFCRSRGIDEKRAYHAGLFLEEMAGNVVSHGFRKDNKKHTVDIRVVHKNDDLILRIRDDCVPFNPEERKDLVDPVDKIKNMGIRMVYKAAKDVQYQNIVGLNVLTIRI